MDTDVPLSGELLLTMNICAFIGVIILSTTTGILKAGTTEHCVEPSESGSCRYCERGWFGNDCNDQCQNCNIGGCNQTTGICQQCSPGYYSINCSIACPLQCRESYGNTLCDRERGRCSDGCKPTWWGGRCENNCSNHCRNSICLYNDGSCHLGCEDGLYGNYCDKTCSTGCGNSTCFSNGTCLNHCNVGYYGPACDGNCTDQCIDRDCVLESDSDLPLCTKGCVSGWQPPYCTISCKPKCTTCNDSGECLSCEGGFWGAFCEYQCSRNCVNNSCNSDGSCAGCRDGWYGTHCDTPCPVRQCRSCFQNNGTCRGCRAGDGDDAGQCVSAKCSRITVIWATVVPILVLVAVSAIIPFWYRRSTRIGQLGIEDRNAHLEQEWKHKTGRVPNGDRVPFDIAMDGKTMITVSHKPEGSAENFRETTNLFVFNRNLVAIRDSVDKRCYIQHSDLTYAAMQAVVNGDGQDTTGGETEGQEERIDVSSLTCKPFTPFAVKLLFGDEIESFCRFHDVYFLDDSNVEVVGKEVEPMRDGPANLRLRRDVEISITVSIGPFRVKVTVKF